MNTDNVAYTLPPDHDDPTPPTPTDERTPSGPSGDFRPGETVACCLVMGLTRAGPAGTTPAPVPSMLSGTVWLVGQDSGVIRQMPRLDVE